MNHRHQILFQQLERYRNEVLQVLDFVTKEHAEVVPKGFHNNIRWNMGHLYLDQYLWLEAITNEKVRILYLFKPGLALAPLQLILRRRHHRLKI